jgi:hypothetical protein
VAYLGVNVGVLGIARALASVDIGAGLGFGLFGVLSIIRLRSIEVDQDEVAYYFAALALGLLGGIALDPTWLAPLLMGAILVALYVADHPRLYGRYRIQVMTLDAAYTDEREIVARLEDMLGAKVHWLKVRRVDLVEDTTVLEVRFEHRREAAPALGAVAALESPVVR